MSRYDGIRGTTALVTGAAQGIGRQVALALAHEGAEVCAVDQNDSVIGDFAEVERITGRVADVSDPEQVAEVVARTEREQGPIGILVNVAGVLRPGPVNGYRRADWDTTFAVNVTGVFTVCQAVCAGMIERRAGVVVTVSSNAAGIPRARMAAYAASKAASTMFTKSLGLELAEYGIRCNVVAPGSTDTAMQRALWDGRGADAVIEGSLDGYRTGIPLRRIAEPQDVADAVLFLCSDQARHITLHDLYVDGGATLRA